MKWTVGKKMFLIGVFVVLGVGTLVGNSFYTNSSITKTSELMHLRNNQIETVNQTLQAHLNLMLNAMDSIIDKDEGKIDTERMETINTEVALINENLKHLDELADTEEEKRLANELHTVFDKLAAGIQKDLVKLIESSGVRTAEIAAEFAKIDDVLDEYGDTFGDNLEGVLSSFKKRRELVGNAMHVSMLASSLKLQVVQVQQWLTDISATRAAEGFDDGLREAEKYAKAFRNEVDKLLERKPEL